MSNIYDIKSEPLHELLRRATIVNANVLIPDLQRPFIWTPNQTALLIDSLIRGWPIGSLLLWKVKVDSDITIPSRPFWVVVDKTDEGSNEKIHPGLFQGDFQMVLDGQQRIQSLILALYGDSYGFKMYDVDWNEELFDKRSRGRRSKNWSCGNLCFDLDSFHEEYEENKNLLQIDYTKVLKWVVTPNENGYSKNIKELKYSGPLCTYYDENQNCKYLRLSRLWELAGTDDRLKESHYKEKLKSLLGEHGIKYRNVDKILDPLGEFMTTLVQAKVQKISYLEVQKKSEVWSDEDYTEAIVNIFTRLNTAGRTLTKEEITFAWLKTKWDSMKTHGKSAEICINELSEELKSNYYLSLDNDELINLLSLMWAVPYNRGNILSNKQLLKSEYISPMADNLAVDWDEITISIKQVCNVLIEKQIIYKDNYLSLNSVGIIWTMVYICELWIKKSCRTKLEINNLRTEISDIITRNIDLWIFCSQWAGKWAGSSGAVMTKYVSELNQDFLKTNNTTNSEDLIKILNDRISGWIKGLKEDAINEINNLKIAKRERVSDYYVILWVWHRLEKSRWEHSKVQLRIKEKSKIYLQVDHIIAYKLWCDKVKSWTALKTDAELKENIDTEEDYFSSVNQIGNCFLLESSINIWKSDKQLGDFFKEIYGFKQKNYGENKEWCDSLGLNENHVYPLKTDLENLNKIIEDRSNKIKKDIVDFINGNTRRCD